MEDDGAGAPGAIIASNDDFGGELCPAGRATPPSAPTTCGRSASVATPSPRTSSTIASSVDVSAGGDFNGAFVANGDDLFVMDHLGGPVSFETNNGQGGCPGDTLLTVFASTTRALGSSLPATTTVAWASAPGQPDLPAALRDRGQRLRRSRGHPRVHPDGRGRWRLWRRRGRPGRGVRRRQPGRGRRLRA
ncbi:MAG: hypothetical protein R3F43_03460 [bacterium]